MNNEAGGICNYQYVLKGQKQCLISAGHCPQCAVKCADHVWTNTSCYVIKTVQSYREHKSDT